MTFSFRCRVNRAPSYTIQSDDSRIDLPSPREGISLSLQASDGEKRRTLKDALSWALIGEGYASESEAEQDGERLRDALHVAVTKTRLGVDFGGRGGGSVLTRAGEAHLEAALKTRVLNDTHGLMIFNSEPKPRFVRADVGYVVGKHPEEFKRAFADAATLSPTLRTEERVAAALFGASFFERQADTRFILLVMAVEALIQPDWKSPNGVALVGDFIARVSSADLPAKERASLKGSLEFLKKESISHAGKRITKSLLGTKTYMEMEADKFFEHIYTLRSNLVHANIPVPTSVEIGNVVGQTESFASDLLVARIVARCGVEQVGGGKKSVSDVC